MHLSGRTAFHQTRHRVSHSVRPLERFPLLGARLERRWSGYRFVLDLWRWMIVVYAYDEREDEVQIIAFEDGRSSRAVLGSRG